MAMTFVAGAQDSKRFTAYSPVVPLLKGVDTNPLTRISVYIPAGEKPTTFKFLQASLNAEGIPLLAAIDVYFTDTEPLFAAVNKLKSLSPYKEKFEIPLDIELSPGMHYFWISARLKADADIDKKVEFRINKIVDADSKTFPLNQEGEGQKKRLGQVVKKAGDGGVNTFRIPGLATTTVGTLIAVYDIRYDNATDLPGNIDVGMSRSLDGGKTWAPMKIIMDMGEPNANNGVGDPAVLVDPITKKIWVAALWSKGNRSIAGSRPGLSEDVTGQLVLVSSEDDGISWSKPKSITSSVKDPKWNLFFNGPGSGIAMQDGKLVFAAQYWDENAMPHSTLLYSSDHGASWKTEKGPKANTTESQLIETSPGLLMLNMRDNRGSYRSVATTSDMGKTWTEHHSSYNALQDPVCMASFIKSEMLLKGKKQQVVLFGNDNTQSGRYNLTIKASLDLGESWADKNALLVDERKFYGYSSLSKIDDKTIGFLYEGVKDLYFVRVPIGEIVK